MTPTDAAPDRAPSQSRWFVRPWLRRAVVVTALLAVATPWIWKSSRRFLAPDELEHLNAAYFISQGETIYGTFFEHHTPVTPLLLQPAVRSSDEPTAIIASARRLFGLMSLAGLSVIALLAARVGGALAAPISVTLLLSHTYFFQRALEIRPDVPAFLCLMVAVWALARAADRGGWRIACAAGALLALGVLASPKVVYPGAGAVAAVLWVRASTAPARRLRAAAQTLAAVSAGGLIVAACVTGALAVTGYLDGFLADVVAANLRMTVETPDAFRWNLINLTLRINTVFWLLALCGGVIWVRRRRELREGPAAVMFGAAAAALAGLLVTNFPLTQYYLLFLPFLAVMGAVAATTLARWASRRSGLLGTALLAALLAGATMPPFWSMRDQLRRMTWQTNIIREVREVVRPGERVFDCFTGLYLTRLPAYRYFFLHPDIQQLVGLERLERELSQALMNPRVTAVLVDRRRFPLLPASVRELVAREFSTFAEHHSGVNVLVRR